MKYEFLDVGDQDACTRKMCFLGPYKLEHVEDHWDYAGTDIRGKRIDVMMMANLVYLWDPIQDEYIEVDANLGFVEYKRDESYSILEDWYACNVLLEKHFGREEYEGFKDKDIQPR